MPIYAQFEFEVQQSVVIIEQWTSAASSVLIFYLILPS